MMKAWMSSVITSASDQGGAPFLALSSETRACSLPISISGTRSAIVPPWRSSGAAGARDAPEYAPGAARRQQPVGLAAEGAEELLLEALAAEIHVSREVGPHLLDEILGGDAAHPDGQDQRQRGRARRRVKEPRVAAAVHVAEPPTEVAHQWVDEGGDRHGLDQDAARPQGVAERRVLRGARRREAAERLHYVEADKLIMAEADLRASEAQLEGRAREAPEAREARAEAIEEPHALDLVDEARDRHADEDRRLLDGADLPTRVEPVVVGERERDALVGEPPLPAELALGDPAVRVGVGDRVGVTHPYEDARRLEGITQDLAECLGTERPVELLRLAAGARHGEVREALLLVGRQGLAQAPHELARAHAHGRMRRALLVLLGHDDHVEARVRVARGAEGLRS